jgi:formylglycine-generating enzyme required for sulfatase activity
MVGNLWEWVALWGMEAGSNGAVSHWPEASPAPYAKDGYWHGGLVSDPALNESGSHQIASGDGGARIPAAVLRGGHWDEGPLGGVFAVSLNDGPTATSLFVGFRCARGH